MNDSAIKNSENKACQSENKIINTVGRSGGRSAGRRAGGWSVHIVMITFCCILFLSRTGTINLIFLYLSNKIICINHKDILHINTSEIT